MKRYNVTVNGVVYDVVVEEVTGSAAPAPVAAAPAAPVASGPIENREELVAAICAVRSMILS